MDRLPRSRPAAEGVSAAGIAEFVEAVAAARVELHSLMVLRHGRVVAEAWWAPYAASIPHLVYSVSKSFASAAVGIAVEEGLVSLDDTLVSRLEEFAPPDVDPRTAAVTVEQALRMATGHLDDTVSDVIAVSQRLGDPEWLRAFFGVAPERAPGSLFAYNQLATYAVGRIVQQAAGCRLVDYLGPRLLDPLGIPERLWLTDPFGHDLGFSGLHLTTESLATFGQLCLQDGVWSGRRLLPEGWVGVASSPLTLNDAAHRGDPTVAVDPDWSLGYGYQFWRSRHGYRADGAFGQFCLVLPDQEAVVVTTACTERMQVLLDLVWAHLLPALGGGGATADARIRMGSRAIRVPASTSPPVCSSTPTARPGDGSLAGVAGIRLLEHSEHHGDGYAVEVVTDEGARGVVPIGDGRWAGGVWPDAPGVVLASAGGWVGEWFRAELRLVRTPHVLQVMLDPATASFSCTWRDEPLHGLRPERYAV